MPYAVDDEPTATDNDVAALVALGQYMITKYGPSNQLRSSKERNGKRYTASQFYAKRVSEEFEDWMKRREKNIKNDAVNEANGWFLDWVRLEGRQDKLKIADFFHRSRKPDDLKSLFNFYLMITIELIDEHRLPIPPALEKCERLLRSAYVSAYGGGNNAALPVPIFDEEYIDDAIYNSMRQQGQDLSTERLKEKFINTCDGIWIVYRFSSDDSAIKTPRDGGESDYFLSSGWKNPEDVNLDAIKVNLSTLRITPYKHMIADGTYMPRFSYSFRSDRPLSGAGSASIRRALGSLFPLSNRINMLGRTVGNPSSVVSLSWNEVHDDNGILIKEGKRRGLAYGTNASFERVSFLFLALYVPNSNDIPIDIFSSVREAYEDLVGAYSAHDI